VIVAANSKQQAASIKNQASSSSQHQQSVGTIVIERGIKQSSLGASYTLHVSGMWLLIGNGISSSGLIAIANCGYESS
jgi:hypothetical protein